jgi:hypothetical protein
LRRVMSIDANRSCWLLREIERTRDALEDMDRERILSTRIIFEKHRGLLE